MEIQRDRYLTREELTDEGRKPKPQSVIGVILVCCQMKLASEAMIEE